MSTASHAPVGIFSSLMKADRLKPVVLWLIWLLFGTTFYAIRNELGWAKGFYMAVNVGYSIGWGYPMEIDKSCEIFSCLYVLVGASAVAVYLGYFAQSMIVASKDWYTDVLLQEDIDKQKSVMWWSWIRLNGNKLRTISVWVLWIFMMMIWSCVTVEWSVIDGLYFSISSLSTGGLWPIPRDSPDWHFAVVALFTATGVPLMALAMGSLASLIVTVGDPEEAEKCIRARVTKEELLMMAKMGLENGEGVVDRSEYILLCALRLGALSPKLIEIINNRFDVLQSGRDGALSYSELLEEVVEDMRVEGEDNNIQCKGPVDNDEESSSQPLLEGTASAPLPSSLYIHVVTQGKVLRPPSALRVPRSVKNAPMAQMSTSSKTTSDDHIPELFG